jgi:hypothetical protein
VVTVNYVVDVAMIWAARGRAIAAAEREPSLRDERDREIRRLRRAAALSLQAIGREVGGFRFRTAVSRESFDGVAVSR